MIQLHNLHHKTIFNAVYWMLVWFYVIRDVYLICNAKYNSIVAKNNIVNPCFEWFAWVSHHFLRVGKKSNIISFTFSLVCHFEGNTERYASRSQFNLMQKRESVDVCLLYRKCKLPFNFVSVKCVLNLISHSNTHFHSSYAVKGEVEV